MTTDRDRFEDLFDRCYPALLAYAVRRTSSAEDAADVVADVFAVAWRRVGELPRGDEARLWLYGAARRVLQDQRRATSRRAALDERLLADARLHHRPVPSSSADDDRLLVAMQGLSDGDRELLRLTAWEELDAPQVARVLGISVAATHVRLHRARRRLRSRLEAGHASPPGPPRRTSPSPLVRATRSEEA